MAKAKPINHPSSGLKSKRIDMNPTLVPIHAHYKIV